MLGGPGGLLLPVLETALNTRLRAILGHLQARPTSPPVSVIGTGARGCPAVVVQAHVDGYRLGELQIYRKRDRGVDKFYDRLVEDSKHKQTSYRPP
jgi:hypothetical protein